MKAVLFSIVTLAVLGFASATMAWTEVANQTIYVDQPTFQQIILRKSNSKYQEVMVQVMNTNGARIQRAEVITDQNWSRPVWRLEGDYAFGMQRTDVFEQSRVRMVRMYLSTLRPGEPVRLRVMMR